MTRAAAQLRVIVLLFMLSAYRAATVEVYVAGGMESMTKAPYLIRKARDGIRLGHSEITDTMTVCRRFPRRAAAGQLSVRLDTPGGRANACKCDASGRSF